ncbi:hypothetical protein D9611_007980 [Ephemerocybe angulata]|uniref:Glyoxylate reductase/hydroxypyruvate reductase n=1 Tax=Ephemerocybe angulata TaxID=980116 RepID=A0A8H5CEN0_9AGAR|nr:hypothetical protein D9611_007980 [Tulosesus angulatus]
MSQSSTLKHKIVVTRNLGPDVMPILEGRTEIDLVVWPEDRACDREWLLRNATGAAALVIMVSDKIDAEVLDAAGPGLRAVSTMSVGYEHVDVKELAKRSIALGYTPDVLTEAVADVCIMLALMAGRNAKQTAALVNEGNWPQFSWAPFLFCGPQLSAPSPSRQRTAGFIGFGRIAKATLARLVPFGFTRCIYGANPNSTRQGSSDDSDKELADRLGLASVRRVDLDTVASESDVVFVLAPGSPSTYHVVNEEFLRRMKKTSVLVNASRGTLVDSDALARVLKEGGIWAAGLDVVEGEPNIPADHPLVREPRCVILPHIGSATNETRVDMASLAANNALAAALGEPMPCALNL